MDVVGHPHERRRALVLIPGVVNYFYNLAGRRIAETLRSLNFDVSLQTILEVDESSYDLCVLCNIPEILEVFENEQRGMSRLQDLRARCGQIHSLSIDCVATPWFKRLGELSLRAGADLIVDLGLIPQTVPSDLKKPPGYHFLFSGLTPSERQTLEGLRDDSEDRSIPWAFVGHLTEDRASLVDQLLQDVHLGGFIYVPALAPYTESGSPHLNQQQFELVLRHARYQVWCSHHEHFYMEPERFRASLLTGGVPIKVVQGDQAPPAHTPFDYLLVPRNELARLAHEDFPSLLRRFQDDWRGLPTMRESLYSLLVETGVMEAPSEARSTGIDPHTDRAATPNSIRNGRRTNRFTTARR